jgi:phosphatidylserine decarboxylase
MTMGFAVFAQYLLPHKLLSRIVMGATRVRWRPWKDFLIRTIARVYRVDWSEAATQDLSAYAHFNAFFTRSLKPGARPFAADPAIALMPADGHISQLGPIRDGRIFQAKGQGYTAAELLADETLAEPYRDGQFATIYLSPRDYHRVHQPWTGRLLETVHVPGKLFSVAPFTVAAVPRLFARNERLVCHFETDFGPMAVVLVGAMLVSGVETVWRGVEIPPYARSLTRREYRNSSPAITLERGAELGRFNMGSTVIVLFPKTIMLSPELQAEAAVRMGQALARRL